MKDFEIQGQIVNKITNAITIKDYTLFFCLSIYTLLIATFKNYLCKSIVRSLYKKTWNGRTLIVNLFIIWRKIVWFYGKLKTERYSSKETNEGSSRVRTQDYIGILQILYHLMWDGRRPTPLYRTFLFFNLWCVRLVHYMNSRYKCRYINVNIFNLQV